MTEPTMRERIARAICDVANKSIGMKPDDGEWVTYLDMADAVLAEMREPTETMAKCHENIGPMGLREIWQAMLDAAASE